VLLTRLRFLLGLFGIGAAAKAQHLEPSQLIPQPELPAGTMSLKPSLAWGILGEPENNVYPGIITWKNGECPQCRRMAKSFVYNPNPKGLPNCHRWADTDPGGQVTMPEYLGLTGIECAPAEELSIVAVPPGERWIACDNCNTVFRQRGVKD
jgi:hypothetical protein